MSKMQKIFFIVATVLCVIALIWGVLAVVFCSNSLIAFSGETAGDSIGGAVLLLYFIIFFLLQGCFSVAAVPFYIMGPLRAPRSKLRVVALVMFLLMLALFLTNMICLLVAF
ncbi:MAG: hypothetical protein IJC99_00870 [Clostridia bacterium]|nr:hypothetical protein [Clostridia bacterium]